MNIKWEIFTTVLCLLSFTKGEDSWVPIYNKLATAFKVKKQSENSKFKTLPIYALTKIHENEDLQNDCHLQYHVAFLQGSLYVKLFKEHGLSLCICKCMAKVAQILSFGKEIHSNENLYILLYVFSMWPTGAHASILLSRYFKQNAHWK